MLILWTLVSTNSPGIQSMSTNSLGIQSTVLIHCPLTTHVSMCKKSSVSWYRKQLSHSLRGHRASDQTLAQLYNGQPVDANNVARNILADRIKDVQVTNVIDQILIERQLKLAQLGLHPGSQINLRSQTPFGGFNVGGLCNPNQVISQQRDEMVDRILENQTLDILKRDIFQAQQLAQPQLLGPRNVLGQGYNAFNTNIGISGGLNFGGIGSGMHPMGGFTERTGFGCGRASGMNVCGINPYQSVV
ncbi:hypothetical protein HDV02_002449 [Globomyces sp. JEL0801]|nr:hypothetical protein HDV02_002449 [Globomyces sp. JEL0801]